MSAKYVAGGNLSCGERTTDRVILQGVLVGTPESDSSELHKQLQEWVNDSPALEITGIPLKVVSCSTYIGDGTACGIQLASVTTPTRTVKVADPDENVSTPLSGIPLYAGIAGGVALLMVVVIVVVLVFLRKKCRSTKHDTSRFVSAWCSLV